MISSLFPSLRVSVDHDNLSLSDLHYALRDLHHLTETMVGHINDMDFGTEENRNHDLDRAFSFARIVSDQVAMLAILAEPLDRVQYVRGYTVEG